MINVWPKEFPMTTTVQLPDPFQIRSIVSIDRNFDVYRDAKGQALQNGLR